MKRKAGSLFNTNTFFSFCSFSSSFNSELRYNKEATPSFNNNLNIPTKINSKLIKIKSLFKLRYEFIVNYDLNTKPVSFPSFYII